MNAHADMLIVVKHNEKYIPRGIYRFLALGWWNFPDFRVPKQAPINAFYYVCYPPPVDVQTSPTLVHGAKVVNYFELSKKKCFWGCFFWCRVYGVECKGGDLLGGVPPSTKPVVGIKHVHEWARSAQLLVNYLRILGNLFRIPVNLFRDRDDFF